MQKRVSVLRLALLIKGLHKEEQETKDHLKFPVESNGRRDQLSLYRGARNFGKGFCESSTPARHPQNNQEASFV